MRDFYLKSTDADNLKEALSFLLKENQEGVMVLPTDTHKYSLDIIGDLYEGSAIGDDGNEVTPSVKIDGFFSNIRCVNSVAGLIPKDLIMETPPTNPQRRFA